MLLAVALIKPGGTGYGELLEIVIVIGGIFWTVGKPFVLGWVRAKLEARATRKARPPLYGPDNRRIT
jgi:hypothetical protein